jgi:hypothetical protein
VSWGLGVGLFSASDEEEEEEEESDGYMKVHNPSMRLISAISLMGRLAKFEEGIHSVGIS